jgi:MOSC domain-containing protein YiiM
MAKATVQSIHIAPAAKSAMQTVGQVMAFPGAGLEGDRYALKLGSFYKPLPDYELTLIESEAIDALKRDYKIEIAPGHARRNIVTSDVALNHLVGRDFWVGEVRIHGIRLCEPCSHLEGLTGQPVIKGLIHRGGLRAQILSLGMIRVGDPIEMDNGHSHPS